MRELMVDSLSENLGQWNALWPQQTRDLESPSHRCSAVLRSNAHDDRRPIFKRGLKDIVMRTCAEAAHLDWQTTDRGGCQIARNGAVWHIRRHGKESICSRRNPNVPRNGWRATRPRTVRRIGIFARPPQAPSRLVLRGGRTCDFRGPPRLDRS